MSIEPQRLGKYELLERLGRGGMAEVRKAFDPQLKRYVAIKIMHADLRADPDFIERFTHEAQIIASLRHPNIIQVHDFQTSSSDSEDSSAYMVMDYIEGNTLADYIRHLRQTMPAGSLPPGKELVQLFTSISLAIDYAHQHSMIHRDIKPTNILLDKNNTRTNPMGEPILSDFGIAKIMGTATGALTISGTGTPLYLSPEQAQGKPGNERSDIYSLGVILYEICTGMMPFQGDNPRAIMWKHIQDVPVPPRLINPNMPAALDVVILRCLAKDPSNRFPSASSLTAALAEALRVPVPEQVAQPRYPLDTADQPTHYSPLPDGPIDPDMLATELVQPSSRVPNTPVLSRAAPTPAFAQQRTQTQQAAEVPVAPGSSGPHQPVQNSPAPVVAPPTPTGLLRMKNRRLAMILIALLIVVLVGTGIAATSLFIMPHMASTNGGTSAKTTGAGGGQNTTVGQAYFLSSGQGGQPGQGVDDEFQVTLKNIPAPAQGKADYAWLLPDISQTEGKPTLLDPLVINNGVASLPHVYVDSQRHNLLTTNSRFVVSTSDANVRPLTPDQNTWIYYATLPQSPNPNDPQHFSGLDHLRHILGEDPTLQKLGMGGGLAYLLLQDSEEMMKWSKEAIDNTTPDHKRVKTIDVLYTLRGLCAPQDLNNLPQGVVQTPEFPVDHNFLPLLECAQSPNPPGQGHILHTLTHLNGLVASPGATANQKTLAAQINPEVTDVNAKLLQLENVAKQLVSLDDNHYVNSPLLWQEDALSREVLGGWTDPATGTIHPGIAEIYAQLQELATFSVQPYTGKQ